ncbi:MAG: DUF721 domain-containing protein [Hyphomicrobiaceae bacterium]
MAARPRAMTAGARAVASFVPAITRKAFEKHGFAAASLITDWVQVVGADLARSTRPERLKWPRAAVSVEALDDASASRPGATLTLRVDPAAALDVQYRKAQIIERINAYFGYRAVADIRIVQAGSDEEINATPPSSLPPAQLRPVAATAPAALTATLASVTDDGLRAALERLAASMAKR